MALKLTLSCSGAGASATVTLVRKKVLRKAQVLLDVPLSAVVAKAIASEESEFEMLCGAGMRLLLPRLCEAFTFARVLGSNGRSEFAVFATKPPRHVVLATIAAFKAKASIKNFALALHGAS